MHDIVEFLIQKGYKGRAIQKKTDEKKGKEKARTENGFSSPVWEEGSFFYLDCFLS